MVFPTKMPSHLFRYIQNKQKGYEMVLDTEIRLLDEIRVKTINQIPPPRLYTW